MLHRPVYGGGIVVGSAVASWLAGVLPASPPAGVEAGARADAPVPDGLVVVAGVTGLVAWDGARPVAAIDTSGQAWVTDDLADDPLVDAAMAARGYRRGEMRMARRVFRTGDAAAATFRATQWTTASMRSGAADAGKPWK